MAKSKKQPLPATVKQASDGLIIADLEHQVADLKGKLKEAASKTDRRVHVLNDIISSQAERIESLSSSKFHLSKAKANKIPSAYCRLIIPDTHGSKIQWDSFRAMLSDAEQLKPKEVVWLGDHIDCGSFLAAHHTIGYTEEMEYTFEEDSIQANKAFDMALEVCSDANHHYVEGNHEHRLEKWCVTTALRQASSGDAKFIADLLRKLFSTPVVLNLDKRGVKYYPRISKQKGMKGRGVISLGRCLFVHGHRTGPNAARNMLSDYSANVCFGHNHQIQTAAKWSVDGEIAAWCPGTLSETIPMWRHSDCTHWTNGYAIQLVRPGGDFLHINVPIIDGRSFLMTLLDPSISGRSKSKK